MLATVGTGSSLPHHCNAALELGADPPSREAFSSQERKDYISAVQCLLTSPSKSDPEFAPGARNRYDDFVAVHINQTTKIHGTVSRIHTYYQSRYDLMTFQGNFLTWHRYFVWAYEEALRNECGYKGSQPVSGFHYYRREILKRI